MARGSSFYESTRAGADPHMVIFGGSSRFYSRNSTGKFQLDVNEIGQAFAEQQSFTDRLHAWRLDRIGKAFSDDAPVALDGPAKLLFHFIPAQSLVGQQPNFNWRDVGISSSITCNRAASHPRLPLATTQTDS